jgi:hypothetical protein
MFSAHGYSTRTTHSEALIVRGTGCDDNGPWLRHLAVEVRVVPAALRRLLGEPAGGARKALGWPKICKLAHAFLWEDS